MLAKGSNSSEHNIKLPVIQKISTRYLIGLHQLKWAIRTKHNITVINNQPFYQSSGKSSGSADTWFPFYGILEHNTDKHPKGWIIKKNRSALPAEIIDKINELVRDLAINNRNLPARFADLNSILISSVLGGGLWNYPVGKVLKTFLKEKYPEFYANCPSYEMLPAIESSKIESRINQWLESHMNQPIKTLMNRVNSNSSTHFLVSMMRNVGMALCPDRILVWAFGTKLPAPLRTAEEEKIQHPIKRSSPFLVCK
ncbi:MAG: hypothetical protein ACHQJ6_00465 [Candidatus Berkiellales bacterium]